MDDTILERLLKDIIKLALGFYKHAWKYDFQLRKGKNVVFSSKEEKEQACIMAEAHETLDCLREEKMSLLR